MKKFIIVFTILESLILINCTSIANDTDEIINMQKDTLNISDFINESEQYTKESMPDIDLNELLSNAITGDINNAKLMKIFWKLLRKRGIKFCNSYK